MAKEKTILLVDDEQAMHQMIGEYLGQHDLRVRTAHNSQEMSRGLAQGSVDLVILDMKLGSEDGLALIRDVRRCSEVPVVVLTGARREEVDRVLGLEMGADDYLLKPFSLRELLARIRAVLRRIEQRAAVPPTTDRHVRYRFAGWELDLRTRRLTAPTGDTVALTHGEFNLLVAFLRAPRHVLSREQLLAATRLHEDVFDRSVDTQVLRLRRKMEADPSQPSLIQTERGAGYVFTAVVETA